MKLIDYLAARQREKKFNDIFLPQKILAKTNQNVEFTMRNCL